MAQADVAIIGGSGLYDMEGLTEIEYLDIETPFGDPSDTIVAGTFAGVRVAFLPRHGRGHRLTPSEVPYRANIYALKFLGVRHIISASAVGSLRKEYSPGDLVLPDDLFDRTKNRASTFFGDGIVAHIAFAHPFCADLSALLLEAAQNLVPTVHHGGTYVCIEGPAFSTYAESSAYRANGFDIIGMTALPEAKLAREAEIAYAVLAQVTDFDCWHPEHDSVTSDMVISTLQQNVANTREVLRRVLPRVSTLPSCSCMTALQGAIATAADAITPEARLRLGPILGDLPVATP